MQCIVTKYCCLLLIECNVIIHHDHNVVIGDIVLMEDLVGVAHISLVDGEG